MPALPPEWLAGAVSHNPWLAAVAIVSATWIEEDLATIAAGMLVAEGAVAADVALPALYAGILLGDMGLYGLGRLIALHRISGRLLNRRRADAFRAWLHGRLLPGVLAARCLPGLRLCAYVTFGFFAMPLPRFAICDVLAASIWTTGLFYLSYEFGALTLDWLGYWRWPAVILAFGVPIFLIQHLLRPEPSAEPARRQKSGERAPPDY